MPKNIQTTAQLCSFHKLARQYSKSFKLSFSGTWTKNFQMYKLDLEKAEEPEVKLSTSLNHRKKKQENSRKTSTSALLTMIKPWTVIQNSLLYIIHNRFKLCFWHFTLTDGQSFFLIIVKETLGFLLAKFPKSSFVFLMKIISLKFTFERSGSQIPKKMA